jgi:hypothetical protein
MTRIALAVLTVWIVGGLRNNTALAETVSPVGPKLTPKLKELIQEEMVQMINSADEITTAIVIGDHDTIAEEATKIVNGFILKRSLTDKDKKDLKKAVPPAFLKLDATFHQTAAKLLQAAQKKDSELEGFYLAKMLGNCVTCHSTYASDKFPGFVE